MSDFIGVPDEDAVLDHLARTFSTGELVTAAVSAKLLPERALRDLRDHHVRSVAITVVGAIKRRRSSPMRQRGMARLLSGGDSNMVEPLLVFILGVGGTVPAKAPRMKEITHWVTSRGRKTKITEMNDRHLINTVRFVERERGIRRSVYKALQAEAVERGLMLGPGKHRVKEAYLSALEAAIERVGPHTEKAAGLNALTTSQEICHFVGSQAVNLPEGSVLVTGLGPPVGVPLEWLEPLVYTREQLEGMLRADLCRLASQYGMQRREYYDMNHMSVVDWVLAEQERQEARDSVRVDNCTGERGPIEDATGSSVCGRCGAHRDFPYTRKESCLQAHNGGTCNWPGLPLKHGHDDPCPHHALELVAGVMVVCAAPGCLYRWSLVGGPVPMWDRVVWSPDNVKALFEVMGSWSGPALSGPPGKYRNVVVISGEKLRYYGVVPAPPIEGLIDKRRLPEALAAKTVAEAKE